MSPTTDSVPIIGCSKSSKRGKGLRTKSGKAGRCKSGKGNRHEIDWVHPQKPWKGSGFNKKDMRFVFDDDSNTDDNGLPLDIVVGPSGKPLKKSVVNATITTTVNNEDI